MQFQYLGSAKEKMQLQQQAYYRVNRGLASCRCLLEMTDNDDEHDDSDDDDDEKSEE